MADTTLMYKMDDYTFSHLCNWAHNYFPEDLAPNNAFAILHYLERLDTDDAEYVLRKDWPSVWDVVSR